MFYLYSTTKSSHGLGQPKAAPTLEGLARQVIEDNDRWGSADLAADYWPEVYWSSPESFTLDDDEREPEQREVTKEMVEQMAGTVWDCYATVVGEEHHTSLVDLQKFCEERFDLDPQGAQGALDTYIKQLEDLEQREVGDEEISDDDAQFLATCVREWVENESAIAPELVDLQNARDDYDDANEQQESMRGQLYRAIRAAAKAGIPRADIAKVSEFSLPQIYKILREAK